jgi:hypothetical protein
MSDTPTHNTEQTNKQTNQVCLFCIGILAPLRVVICVWLCHSLPLVFFWLQVFICVCAQVCCSVVCNWSLCDLFVNVCFLTCSDFNLLSIIFIFFDLETPDDG